MCFFGKALRPHTHIHTQTDTHTGDSAAVCWNSCVIRKWPSVRNVSLYLLYLQSDSAGDGSLELL